MASDKPLVVMFIGGPGSGKSFFGKQLADKLGAVRLNSDAMRLAIFGSIEEIGKVYHSKNRQNVNTYVFGALDYVVTELLERRKSIVYEAVFSKRMDRKKIEEIALKTDAIAVLVHIKTDREVAIDRVQSREVAADSRRFDEQQAREVILHFERSLEPPSKDENVIEISGEIPFDDQYEQFTKGVKLISDKYHSL